MDRPPKSEALERLKKALNEIDDLKKNDRGCAEFARWQDTTERTISYAFGDEAPARVQKFKRTFQSFCSFTALTPESYFQQSYVRDLENAGAVLRSMIEEIQEYWQDESGKPVTNGISIYNSPGVQIGDHNTQNIKRIDTGPGAPEKTSRLWAFLERRLISPFIGWVVSHICGSSK